MIRSGFGYLTATTEEGVKERDTFTCGHACGGIVHFKARVRPEDAGAMCKVCMRLVCGKCTPHGQCLPIEEWLEALERPRIRRFG